MSKASLLALGWLIIAVVQLASGNIVAGGIFLAVMFLSTIMSTLFEIHDELRAIRRALEGGE